MGPGTQAGGGVTGFEPATLRAAQEQTLRLVFVVGPDGFPEGSKLKVQDADFHGMGWTMFQSFQTVTPTAEGYLTVTCRATLRFCPLWTDSRRRLVRTCPTPW